MFWHEFTISSDGQLFAFCYYGLITSKSSTCTSCHNSSVMLKHQDSNCKFPITGKVQIACMSNIRIHNYGLVWNNVMMSVF